MPWSLVEAIAEAGSRRPFYPPLASASPEFSSVRQVDQNQFDPVNDHTTDPNDPRLSIVVSPPQSGQFTNEGSLPDPAIRLHAIGAGWVRFKPAHANSKNSLELKLAAFPTFMLRELLGVKTYPLWWQQWLDAECIPDRVIYENVDATALQEVLNNLRVPVDTQFSNRVLSTHGLRFPNPVTHSTSAQFITQFMAGDEDHFLVAEAGAYLCAAAPEVATSTDPHAPRLITLHARYHDHKETSPHPMNPLELFYLLFGNDSAEAQTHPLLLKLDAKGKAQSGHESKSMRLRPPLRTHARLMWEAGIETVDEIDPTRTTPDALKNYPNWQPGSDVKDRFYNDFQGTDAFGQVRHFDRWAYNSCAGGGCWKCNLFTLDVALRAGFRVVLLPIANTSVWHYEEPNRVVQLINQSLANSGQQPVQRAPVKIKFQNGLKTETLAWNIEGMLRSHLSTTALRNEINRQITEEGRCFVVAGSRAGNSGHMVLVERLLNDDNDYKLKLASSPNHGFSTIIIQSREASGIGAVRRELAFTLTDGYSSIHMFELHPGKDPDTPLGLQDCNGAVYS